MEQFVWHRAQKQRFVYYYLDPPCSTKKHHYSSIAVCLEMKRERESKDASRLGFSLAKESWVIFICDKHPQSCVDSVGKGRERGRMSE